MPGAGKHLLRDEFAVSSKESRPASSSTTSRIMKLFRWLPFCFLAALLAMLPACTGKKSDKLKVAFISNNAYEFWTFARQGTQDAAAEFDDVDVEFKMP